MKQTDPNLLYTNVFQATEDAYVMDSVLDDSILFNSPYHELHKRINGKTVILDPLAPDYKDLLLEKGTILAPNEILEAIKPLALKIPLKPRADFEPDDVPSSELLRAIHYYSNFCKLVPHSLDETALLALGMAAELWADELIGGNPLVFLLNDDTQPPFDFPPDSLDSSELELEIPRGSEVSDSDIMSLDLLESDTDEEIKENKSKRLKVDESSTGESFSNNKSSGSDAELDSSSGSGSRSGSDSGACTCSDSDSGLGSDTDSGSKAQHARSSSNPGSGSESHSDFDSDSGSVSQHECVALRNSSSESEHEEECSSLSNLSG
ncbi:hypothetical protein METBISCDRAFT_30793 [Metschnikowia bicuspidata]|uniref:Uncharacterized protein n=1 Tax=Metschnikowia bicuspidata TaxID=27322 RepID=A0A4P9ZCK2_9ASCO|nr:hypothetical protein METBISCDRAFT_30793 [Metschnikowia bicuspidata]